MDNYDSFVYNLAQYVGELDCEALVFRNDKITPHKARELRPDRIVISPGPGNPCDPRYFGACSGILRSLGPTTPTLGVCLGHQGIAATFGGEVRPAHHIMHGKTSRISHDGRSILAGVKNPFEATRYHSLVVEESTLPRCLVVTARSLDDSEVMGIRHVDYPIEGVQFHPESIASAEGRQIIRNFVVGGVKN